MSEENQKQKTSEDKRLTLARKRYKLAVESYREINEKSLEDLKFRSGDQWPEPELQKRNIEERPSLVINKIPQFINQITNDQRQNSPEIKVYPVDDKADPKTAKILQGLIRHIEYNSNAKSAYATAFDSAVTMGFGFFRILTDFENPQSFNQEILIKRIRNQFSVKIDPSSKELDGSDMNWAFIEDELTKEEFKDRFPDAEFSQFADWGELSKSYGQDWIDKDKIRVVEYFYKEFKEREILLLSDGNVVFKDEFDVNQNPLATVIDERKTKVPQIKWIITNGHEVLEERDWIGEYIPVIPVYGAEIDIQGKRILEGLIRHAKDSQRMYNYWASSETESIALAPKAPYIVAEGQITDKNKENWAAANKKSHGFLEYKPTSFNGQMAPPPQRQSFEPAVQAITNARMLASEDIKSTTGIYDSSLGMQGNETSGIAIQRRNSQAQTSNYHFLSNFNISMRHLGKILIDLIPRIYDTSRVQRIIGEDDSQELVMLNQPFEKDGEQLFYDLGTGKYDIIVDSGPSYATKRQEALASMLDLTRSFPQVAQIAGDLMVKNMDWKDAEQIANRLKRTVPPEVLGEESKQPQVPPQVQAQMQQMGQMIDELSKRLNDASEVIKNKRVEIESRERIAFAQMEVDIKKELLKSQAKASEQILAEELADIRRRLELLDYGQDFDDQFKNEESGLDEAATFNEQQMPTDGPQTSGQPMEGMP